MAGAQGGAKQEAKIGPLTGTIVMRSVSLFLASGRRASRARTTSRSAHSSHVQPAQKTRAVRMNQAAAVKPQANKCPPKIVEHLRKTTFFTKTEIEALYKIYRKLVLSNQAFTMAKVQTSRIDNNPIMSKKQSTTQEGIDRTVFRELLHNTFDLVPEDALSERMFCAWDKANEGVLRLEPWLQGLSVFLKGNIYQRAQFCFKVYDLNSDGYVSREEMLLLLKNCLVQQPQEEDPDEGVKELVELITRKMDLDHDGKISFEDYYESIKNENLLMECFGSCLPTTAAVATFLSTLQP